jgi:hypothetical protein
MLKKLDGTPISGSFSARRLRRFIPKEGTKLADEQAELEKRMVEKQSRKEVEETATSGEKRREEGNEPPQDDDEHTEGSQVVEQATRTPPQGGGAHGVL